LINNNLNSLKKKIIQIAHKSNEGHLGSSFSVLDILYVLYNKCLDISLDNVEKINRDYLILSKGHASLGHAAILWDLGFITESDLDSFCSFDSILGGHLSRNKVTGVDASTGSLGHGIAIATGLSMAFKVQKFEHKVVTIVGDGEINEGTFWESALLASHHNLDNLFCFIDFNRSNDRALKLDPLSSKLDSFGWNIVEIDGHNHLEIEQAISKKINNKPSAIIAKTTKGKGVSEMENNHAWHHRSPNFEEMGKMLKELS